MGFKKVLKKIGKVALKAAPIAAAFIPGVGPLAAMGLRAGIGAATSAAQGGGWKGALVGGGLGAIPGGGAGAVGSNVAKVGLKEIAKGVAKGAATNFAAGVGSGALTGQGVKGSLASGLTGATSGGVGAGGLGAAAKTVGKNVAQNVGGHYAGQGLQKAGVPGALAQQGGNVFSDYLGGQFNKPAVQPSTSTAGFGASARPAGPGGIDFTNGFMPGGGATTGTGAAGMNWQTPLKTGLGALATGIQAKQPGWNNTTGSTGTTGTTGTGTIPRGNNPIPTSTGLPGGGGPIPRGSNPIPTSTGQIPATTGQRPQVQAPATQQQQTQNPNRPATWSERYGPLIVQGAGVVGGALIGREAQKNAMKRSPEEQAALEGAQGAAGQLGRFGGQSWQQGRDLQQAPGQYFQSLLSGNRAAMSQAIAGPAAQITGNYRGAGRALDQQGVRGAARDVAQADLNRDRVSKIAGLTTGIQPYAAEQLTSMGQQQQALAPGMLANAGQLHQGLLTSGAVNRQYARQEGADTAKAIGGLAREAGEVVFKRPQGGAATPQQPPQQQPQQGQQPPAQQGGVSTPPPVAPVQAPPYRRPLPTTGYPSTNVPLPNFGGQRPPANNPWGNVSFGY